MLEVDQHIIQVIRLGLVAHWQRLHHCSNRPLARWLRDCKGNFVAAGRDN